MNADLKIEVEFHDINGDKIEPGLGRLLCP